MKTEIKIAVADKAQAMQYKAILEALGEKISPLYYWDSTPYEERQNTLAYNNVGWICTSENYTTSRRPITIAQLVEMLTKPKQTVVKITSQVEYTTLMRDYLAKGWKWAHGNSPNPIGKHHSFPVYAEYNDNFVLTSTSGDKEVISFKSLKLKAPDHIAEDGMPLWLGDKFWGVQYNRKNGWGYYDCGLSNFVLASISPTKSPNIKIFSTKNAALEWESAHRKVVMSEDGYAICYGDKYHCAYIYSDGNAKAIGRFVLGEASGVITSPEVYKAFKTKEAAKAWVAKQKRTVLLTTEDGVDLRVCDRYYYAKRLPYSTELTVHTDLVAKGVLYSGKYFSTAEAARAYINEQRPVLLTTEDGVDLREYDRWYPAYKDEKGWYVGCNTFTMYTDSLPVNAPSPERVVFSTKEAAEAWVEKQNSPVLLTSEDGVELREDDEWWGVSDTRWARDKSEEGWRLKNLFGAYKLCTSSVCLTDPEHCKAFSTKEAAEAWVEKQNTFGLPEYLVEQMYNALAVPKTILYQPEGGRALITKEKVVFYCDGNPLGVHMDAKDLIEIYNLHKAI